MFDHSVRGALPREGRKEEGREGVKGVIMEWGRRGQGERRGRVRGQLGRGGRQGGKERVSSGRE